MNKNKLQTGWKHWDITLSKFVDKKVNIMEIGVYEGKATIWFLKNIMTNKKSNLIAIDTFGGSPEYNNKINFNEIEKKFYENIKKTGRDKQVLIMKMMSEEALIKLANINKMKFDIIFIDASHEAKDVLSDNVLSWKLLKDNGILINDDYKWDKLNKNYFRPKIAIDSFINCYYPEIKILYKGYQMILEKIPEKKREKPKVKKLDKNK
jgi:predicted O-methyltransferase YrrM